MEKEFLTITDLDNIVISNGRNVRYYGRALDKCDLSHLIRSLAITSGIYDILWSDIYWYSSTKLELVNYMREFIVKCRNKLLG